MRARGGGGGVSARAGLSARVPRMSRETGFGCLAAGGGVGSRDLGLICACAAPYHTTQYASQYHLVVPEHPCSLLYVVVQHVVCAADVLRGLHREKASQTYKFIINGNNNNNTLAVSRIDPHPSSQHPAARTHTHLDELVDLPNVRLRAVNQSHLILVAHVGQLGGLPMPKHVVATWAGASSTSLKAPGFQSLIVKRITVLSI